MLKEERQKNESYLVSKRSESGLCGSPDKGKDKGKVGRERTMSKKIVHVIKRVSQNNRE